MLWICFICFFQYLKTLLNYCRCQKFKFFEKRGLEFYFLVDAIFIFWPRFMGSFGRSVCMKNSLWVVKRCIRTMWMCYGKCLWVLLCTFLDLGRITVSFNKLYITDFIINANPWIPVVTIVGSKHLSFVLLKNIALSLYKYLFYLKLMFGGN